MTRQLIVRSFTVDLNVVDDDGMIRGKCVPYGEVATVNDGRGPYKEMFDRGAFRRAIGAPHRVLLDFEHQLGILDVVGHATELVERDDGLHGTFRPMGAPGDQARELVRAGVLTGLSVRAITLGPGRRQGDVLVRTACHLDRVALCREPAYASAVVAALRSVAMPMEPPELTALRPTTNSELDERLRQLGIDVGAGRLTPPADAVATADATDVVVDATDEPAVVLGSSDQ